MTTKEAAEKWGISERRINVLCAQKRIEGAIKEDGRWSIPDSAHKPEDRRIKSRQEEIVFPETGKKPLPIGISDYRKASVGYYYVDKTLLIKDILDERPQVSLFTRPRRFGKSLNMDMLRVFFEKTDEDTSRFFRDKKIWACGRNYQEHQGKYPVIAISFKDVRCETWELAYDLIYRIISEEFARHSELTVSDRISDYDKKYYQRILDGNASENEVGLSFLKLSRLLHIHYGIAPIIIIDEYDTPIQQSYAAGYYDRMISFMRLLFSGGLKDNPHLSFGFLTGILRVAKESIFSGLNNLKVNSLLEDRYSQYFGFTPHEVMEMAAYYGRDDKYQEIMDWYDGYRFGNSEIFNPWSVSCYFSEGCIARPFWVSTSSNEILKDILPDAPPEIFDSLCQLMQGRSVETSIDTGVVYPVLHDEPSCIFSFLLMTGYLKTVRTTVAPDGGYICEVEIPNREISFVYSREIIARNYRTRSARELQDTLFLLKREELQKKLENFLLESVGYHDTSSESFYHGLMLGLCAIANGRYHVSSERESGKGRYDIMLVPMERSLPGIVIELKTGKNLSESSLESLAQEALEQIRDRKYQTELVIRNVEDILLYGVAFSGKDVRVRSRSLSSSASEV